MLGQTGKRESILLSVYNGLPERQPPYGLFPKETAYLFWGFRGSDNEGSFALFCNSLSISLIPNSDNETLVYHFLRGRLIETTPGRVILDVNGLGYEVVMPVGGEPGAKQGSEIQLWTHLHFKDDSFQLFGFTRRTDRDLFRLLLKVTGVGPKSALQVLSGIQPEELVQVMAQEDWKRLTLIPGIGPKTARRLLIELKEKLTAQELQFIPSGSIPSEPVFRQAFAALTNLGFSPEAARSVLKEVAEQGETNLETILKKAIARLAP